MKQIVSFLFAMLLMQFFHRSVSVAQTNVPFEKASFPTRLSEFTKAEKEFNKGDDALNDGFYRIAIQKYLLANEFNPNNDELNYKLGICYLNTSSKEKAKSHFEKAYQLNATVAPDILYYLALCNHLENNWDKAENLYRSYLAKATLENNKTESDITAKRLLECQFGREMVLHPTPVKIENIGAEVNSAFTDYSPVVTSDEDVLYFTSRRPGTTTGPKGEKDVSIDEFWEDVYVTYNFNGKWTKPKNSGPPLNTVGHESTNNISPDGELLLLCIDESGQGDIYESHLQNLAWTKPVVIPEPISTKYHETSVTINKTKDTLYFVSERPGGQGGKDIYMATRPGPTIPWSSVVNLGPVINTRYDEESVFLMPDGRTLYFSSKGHDSMGGFDIFKSERSNGTWGKPVNMGYPLNTSDDDVNFVVGSTTGKGYYSSIKNDGVGERDLYTVEFLKDSDTLYTDIVIAGKQSSNTTILRGSISDSYTQSKLSAEVVLYNDAGGAVLATMKTIGRKGTYAAHVPSGITIRAMVSSPNYEQLNEPVVIPLSDKNEILEKNFKLNALSSAVTIIRGTITDSQSKSPLQATLVVRDSQSEKEVVNIKTSVGGTFEIAIPAGRNYELTARATDYMKGIEAIEIPMDKKGQTLEKNISLSSLQVGNKIILKNVFYDFNQATLRPSSIVELNRLVDLLQEYPGMRIELSSHTDNKGSGDYNLTLSNNRSKSCVDYLIKNGIDKKRLEYKGYGLTQPITTNDTEEGRQLNRRTEFKILSK